MPGVQHTVLWWRLCDVIQENHPSGLQFPPLRWQDWTFPSHQTIAFLIIALSDTSTPAHAMDF